MMLLWHVKNLIKILQAAKLYNTLFIAVGELRERKKKALWLGKKKTGCGVGLISAVISCTVFWPRPRTYFFNYQNSSNTDKIQ